MLSIAGCASTQTATQTVKDPVHVDRPVILEKYISPPENLLVHLRQCRNANMPIMPKDSTWRDLVKHTVRMQYELSMCKDAANALIKWERETKQIDAET